MLVEFSDHKVQNHMVQNMAGNLDRNYYAAQGWVFKNLFIKDCGEMFYTCNVCSKEMWN